MSILDGSAIRRRRLELGISERALARRLGVTSGVIAALEKGTNHRVLTVGMVDALAIELGVAISALLPARPDPEPEAGPGTDRPACLAAMLVMAGGHAQAEALAEAAGWSLSELAAAMRELNAALGPLALWVARTSAGTVRLRTSEPGASRLMDQLARAEASQRGLDHGHARVLFDVAAGRADTAWQRAGGESRRVAVGFLERSGLIERQRSRLVLTDAARASLAAGNT